MVLHYFYNNNDESHTFPEQLQYSRCSGSGRAGLVNLLNLFSTKCSLSGLSLPSRYLSAIEMGSLGRSCSAWGLAFFKVGKCKLAYSIEFIMTSKVSTFAPRTDSAFFLQFTHDVYIHAKSSMFYFSVQILNWFLTACWIIFQWFHNSLLAFMCFCINDRPLMCSIRCFSLRSFHIKVQVRTK